MSGYDCTFRTAQPGNAAGRALLGTDRQGSGSCSAGASARRGDEASNQSIRPVLCSEARKPIQGSRAESWRRTLTEYLPRTEAAHCPARIRRRWTVPASTLPDILPKNLVAAGLCERCQVTLAYAIGRAEPVMTQVDTLGTGTFCADDCLADAVKLLFPLTPPQRSPISIFSRRATPIQPPTVISAGPGFPGNARIWPPRCGRLSCNIMH